MEYGLGIDFGTTYSAAAISTARGVEICTLGTRAASIPTVVLVRADGEVLVGEAAERRAKEEPDRGAFAFKRRLGDSTPLVLGGTPYGAETLTSYVLGSIVRQVTQLNGGPPAKIVVTHPAPFGEYKVDQLRLAARQADIGPVTFISEPEAAAVHYATLERIDIGEVVAVYDFGGGTFDAALLRRTADGFTLIGHPEGLERIGGIDLDHAVLQHVLGAIGTQPAELMRDDAGLATARLRDDCKLAKEALSSDADVTIPVSLPNLMTHVRLTRVEFEAMIRPRIADTIDALRRAVRSAGLTMDEVARILLVGGSSRIPLVREMVAGATGRPVTIDVHPKHSVAMGAAALALPAGTPTAPAAPAALAPPAAGAGPLAAPSAPAPPSPPGTSPALTAPEPNSSGSKRKILLGVGALAVVAIIAAVAIVLAGGDDSKKSSDTGAPQSSSATVSETTDPTTETGETQPVDSATTDTGTVDTATGDTETSDTGTSTAVETEPFAGMLPRSTQYATLAISIDRLIVRTQDPASYEAGTAAEPDGPRWAYIEGSAMNPLKLIPVVISETHFTLVLANGTELNGGQLGNDPAVAPASTSVLNIAFELGDVTDLAGSRLVIGDDGDEPSTIALDGDPVESDLDRDVSYDPANLSIADAAGNTVDWGLGQSSTSLDSYYDGPDQPTGQPTAARRAGVGQRWLNITVILTAGACECEGLAVDTSMVTLIVDGAPIAPTNTFSHQLAPSTSIEEGLIFEYPVSVTSVSLQIGPPDSPELQQSSVLTLA